MPPRGFTNPAPKTESARSALSSFTCSLCNKSYSRHPEYEAHISSYDHQHRKRLQDLKQLSRDPNAAEKARRAERKADAEAGLRVIDAPGTTRTSGGGSTSSASGGFKKGGFKSSFAAVKGPAAPVKKNVLGDDDDDDGDGVDGNRPTTNEQESSMNSQPLQDRSTRDDVESDIDEEDARDRDGDYYDPRRPTDCFPTCAGLRDVKAAT
ncbi:uncharacterized protein N7459_000779 [Penicillium hispanicum]|uniref:uncharacterized protein n=1 Tax=Penicillium hispanicum TaxID=1080232 RepID=UPI0025425A41|nr:uncharacterized protein N7459_000779 [Penicillium hispanicum]KAJ5594571.1 hypothetical protein N7459_000779 [Penicillium hispanicum]